MITVYPFEQLGGANHGWLDAKHHFSFSSYYSHQTINQKSQDLYYYIPTCHLNG